MVTTDGHRLAFIEKTIDDKQDAKMDTLVPEKSPARARKALTRAKATSRSARTRTTFISRPRAACLITRKLTGNFPNYEMVMPKDNDKRSTFDLDDMRTAVRRISLIADERNRSIRLTVREGEVEVTAQSSEEGEGSEVVPAEYTGDGTHVGFNWQYLLEFLTNAATGGMELTAEGSGPAETTTETDARSASARVGRRNVLLLNSRTQMHKPKCPLPARPLTTISISSCL